MSEEGVTQFWSMVLKLATLLSIPDSSVLTFCLASNPWNLGLCLQALQISLQQLMQLAGSLWEAFKIASLSSAQSLQALVLKVFMQAMGSPCQSVLIFALGHMLMSSLIVLGGTSLAKWKTNKSDLLLHRTEFFASCACCLTRFAQV